MILGLGCRHVVADSVPEAVRGEDPPRFAPESELAWPLVGWEALGTVAADPSERYKAIARLTISFCGIPDASLVDFNHSLTSSSSITSSGTLRGMA